MESKISKIQKFEKILPVFSQCFKEQLQFEDNKQHPIFHGSWDWHSACHGHWALLESSH